MTIEECVAQAMGNGLGSELKKLEKQRLEMEQGNRRILLTTFAVLLAATFWAGLKGLPAVGYIVISVLAIVICIFMMNRRKKRVAGEFKQQIIPKLLDQFMPGFTYNCRQYVDEDEFNYSGLFISPDRYNGQDYFEGKHGKTELHFSLVHAEERYETTSTDTDSDGHTTTRTEEHWRDIFKGLFFAADFNKHFSGSTLVRAGKAGWFSGLFGNLVKLEDPRFSECFKVYSSDQVEARYILTPRLMERLLELRSHLGGFEVSFKGSWVHIAADGFPYDAFEPDVGRPFTDTRQVSSTLGWIFLVVGIVEELDLNTRIWSKS